MTQRFVQAVKGSAGEEFAESFNDWKNSRILTTKDTKEHRGTTKLPRMPKVPKNPN
jgi:hypothetical protein